MCRAEVALCHLLGAADVQARAPSRALTVGLCVGFVMRALIGAVLTIILTDGGSMATLLLTVHMGSVVIMARASAFTSTDHE